MNCTPKVGQKKLTFEVFLYELSHKDKVILFENQNYPLSTCLDELKFYRRLRFLGYF